MPDEQELQNLEQLLDRLKEAAQEQEEVTFGEAVDAVGRRSFGPLLLAGGVMAASPLSGIPGMPTTIGTFVILIASQLLMRRESFWLPKWMRKRKMSSRKFCKAMDVVRKPARFIDRGLRPRLQILSERGAEYGIAALCVLIAATMPPLEFVPFAATGAGAAIAIFGLALIANDGLVALIAIAVTVGLVILAVQTLLL